MALWSHRRLTYWVWTHLQIITEAFNVWAVSFLIKINMLSIICWVDNSVIWNKDKWHASKKNPKNPTIKHPTAQQPYSKYVYFDSKNFLTLAYPHLFLDYPFFLVSKWSISFASILIHQLDPGLDSWFLRIFSAEDSLQRLSKISSLPTLLFPCNNT